MKKTRYQVQIRMYDEWVTIRETITSEAAMRHAADHSDGYPDSVRVVRVTSIFSNAEVRAWARRRERDGAAS